MADFDKSLEEKVRIVKQTSPESFAPKEADADDEEDIIEPTEPSFADQLRDIQVREQELNLERQEGLATKFLAEAQGRAQEEAEIALTELELQDIQRERQDVIEDFEERSLELEEKIQGRRQELATLTPKSFWTRADTSDKVLMALSVMVGALGQGLSQSKSNAALDMMKRVVDRDLNQQTRLIEQKFKNAEAAAKGNRARLKELRQAKLTEIEGRRQAAVDHLESSVKRIQLQTQNAAAVGELQKALAEIQGAGATALKSSQEAVRAEVAQEPGAEPMPEAVPFAQLPKDRQETVKILTQKNANILAIR